MSTVFGIFAHVQPVVNRIIIMVSPLIRTDKVVIFPNVPVLSYIDKLPAAPLHSFLSQPGFSRNIIYLFIHKSSLCSGNKITSFGEFICLS